MNKILELDLSCSDSDSQFKNKVDREHWEAHVHFYKI